MQTPRIEAPIPQLFVLWYTVFIGFILLRATGHTDLVFKSFSSACFIFLMLALNMGLTILWMREINSRSEQRKGPKVFSRVAVYVPMSAGVLFFLTGIAIAIAPFCCK